MKIVFMLVGLLLSTFTLATPSVTIKPISLRISNDNQAKITLSNQDINRFFVVNDKIASLNAPNHRVIAHNDPSGSIFINIIGKAPFTAFITTEKERHFSLWVIPKSEPGVTVRFIPTTPIFVPHRHSSYCAKRFEQASSYEKTLVTLIRDVMLQHRPPGYTSIATKVFHQMSALQLLEYRHGKRFLKEKVIAGFLGDEFAVRIVRLTNKGPHRVTLIPRDFYTPFVRAVAVVKETLAPHESTLIYEVTSRA